MQMLDDSLFDFLHMEMVNLLVELDVSRSVNGLDSNVVCSNAGIRSLLRRRLVQANHLFPRCNPGKRLHKQAGEHRLSNRAQVRREVGVVDRLNSRIHRCDPFIIEACKCFATIS